MSKSFLLTAGLVMAALYSFGQQFNVHGVIRVVKTGSALPGATVEVLDSRKYAIADEFGRFTIKQLPQGEHRLAIKFLGYVPKNESVVVDAEKTITIEMEESVQMTEEVIVYATRAHDKTPTTFTTVDKPAIAKQNFGQDLPYLLNWTPSVVTTSDAGTGFGYTGVRIRGSDATSINVTINGIPYNDSESLGTFWVDIPDIASSTRSIQIQRGVGTSTNGAGAFGGTVNLQTTIGGETPFAEATLAVGSFNTRRFTVSAGTGLTNDHWSAEGRLSRIVSDGYIDRAYSDLESYYFSAGYRSNNTLLSAVFFGGSEVTYQSWYGIDPDMMS